MEQVAFSPGEALARPIGHCCQADAALVRQHRLEHAAVGDPEPDRHRLPGIRPAGGPPARRIAQWIRRSAPRGNAQSPPPRHRARLGAGRSTAALPSRRNPSRPAAARFAPSGRHAQRPAPAPVAHNAAVARPARQPTAEAPAPAAGRPPPFLPRRRLRRGCRSTARSRPAAWRGAPSRAARSNAQRHRGAEIERDLAQLLRGTQAIAGEALQPAGEQLPYP